MYRSGHTLAHSPGMDENIRSNVLPGWWVDGSGTHPWVCVYCAGKGSLGLGKGSVYSSLRRTEICN